MESPVTAATINIPKRTKYGGELLTDAAPQAAAHFITMAAEEYQYAKLGVIPTRHFLITWASARLVFPLKGLMLMVITRRDDNSQCGDRYGL